NFIRLLVFCNIHRRYTGSQAIGNKRIIKQRVEQIKITYPGINHITLITFVEFYQCHFNILLFSFYISLYPALFKGCTNDKIMVKGEVYVTECRGILLYK